MSATAESDDTLVRQLPTDDLRAPQHDVRQTRSDEDIRTIAESMERSGQLHAAYVVPVCPSDVDDEDEWRSQPVETLDSECTSYRLIDGMTRWLAAQELNWATLRCEVHSEPPENQTVTSLEANTSRVDMSDYETTRALYDHYQRTGHTQAEIAETAGISRSRLGNLFRALDGFDQAVKAWRDPDTHVSSGHVLQIERLETSAHKARAFRDLMHNQRSVSMLSEVVDNVADMEQREIDDAKRQLREADEEVTEEKVKELVDGTGPDNTDSPAEAATRKAEKESGAPAQPDPVMCLITGAEADRKVAVPVSSETAGLIEQCKSENVPLLEALGGDEE